MEKGGALLLVMFLLLVLCNFRILSAVGDYYYAAGNAVVIYPQADSFVDSTEVSRNAGGLQILSVSNYHDLLLKLDHIQNAYLLFNLSRIPPEAKIKSAAMRIHVRGVSMATSIMKVGVHYCSNNSWNEFEVTWVNAPSFANETTDTSEVYMPGTYNFFNVTEDAEASWRRHRMLTEVLTVINPTEPNAFSQISSREHPLGEEVWPQLNVTYTLVPPTYGIEIPSINILVIPPILAAIAVSAFILLRRRHRATMKTIALQRIDEIREGAEAYPARAEQKSLFSQLA